MLADNMRKKKREKEKTLEEIEKYRCESGFLPYYSDTFFESSRSYRNTTAILGIYLSIYLMIYLLVSEKKTAFICYSIFILLVLLCLTFVADMEKKIGKYGYHLLEDRIVLRKWGMEREISYNDIRTKLQERKVKVTEKKLVVPTNKGNIAFSYEVGNAKQQKHVMACYEMLRTKVVGNMPAINMKNLDIFDKAYFYNKSYRKCMIVLLVVQIGVFFWSFGDTTNHFFYVFNGLTALIQYITIYRLFRSVRCSVKNWKKMKTILGEAIDAGTCKIAIRSHGFIEFYVIAVVVIILNYLLIMGNVRF